jgi:hypothetical protein
VLSFDWDDVAARTRAVYEGSGRPAARERG